MPLTLDEAVSRVPQWKDAREIKTTPLSGGITNINYRIDVSGESFVLRLPGADTELLGINRDYEYAANQAAGVLGIAPEVYFFIQPEGCLVTRFISGRSVPVKEMQQPEFIQMVMSAVNKLHALPGIPGVFNPFQVISDYSQIAQDHGVAFPKNYSWLMDQVQKAEQALLTHPTRLQPCHNDLLNANFLFSNQLYILDWEYAGMGDPYFDLANFSDHHALSDEHESIMFSSYFGDDFYSHQIAHLKIMKVISDLREATWGLVQTGISKLDFDFREYADQFYDRVLQNINNPQWNHWLKEVSYHV